MTQGSPPCREVHKSTGAFHKVVGVQSQGAIACVDEAIHPGEEVDDSEGGSDEEEDYIGFTEKDYTLMKIHSKTGKNPMNVYMAKIIWHMQTEKKGSSPNIGDIPPTAYTSGAKDPDNTQQQIFRIFMNHLEDEKNRYEPPGGLRAYKDAISHEEDDTDREEESKRGIDSDANSQGRGAQNNVQGGALVGEVIKVKEEAKKRNKEGHEFIELD